MKRYVALLASMALTLVLAAVMPAAAGAAMSPSGDAGKLTSEVSMLNYDAELPHSDTILMKQLTDNFKVPDTRISSLMNLGRLQVGEAAAVLGIAEKMPGGLTDANISKVSDMRGKGWEQAARSVGVDPAIVASKLNMIETTAHNNIKQAFAESIGQGAAAGGTGQNMPEVSGEGTGGHVPGTESGMSSGPTGGSVDQPSSGSTSGY